MQEEREFHAPPIKTSLPVMLMFSGMALLYLFLMTLMKQPHRLALVACLAGLAVFISRPRIETLLPGLPFALGLGYYEIGMPPFQPTLATLAGMTLLLLWILEKVVWNGSPVLPRGVGLRLALAGLLFQTISVFMSVHYHGQHVWNAIREGSGLFLFLPLAIILPERLTDEADITRIIRASVLALLVVGSVGVAQYFGTASVSRLDMSIGYTYRLRVFSTLPAANVLAGYLEMLVPMSLASLLCEKSRGWRVVSLTAFATGFLSVLFTFSRGGFFMTVAANAAVLVYSFRRKPFVPLAAGVLFFYVMATNSDTFARQLSLVTEPRDVVTQPTLLHRALTYDSFWHVFSRHPWTGVGWGAREFFWGGTPIYTFWDVRHALSTEDIQHFGGLNSVFFNQAVKGGIFAVIALAFVALALVRASYEALLRPVGVMPASIVAGLGAFAFHELVDNLVKWPQTNGVFWMQIGLLGAISLCRKRGGTFCTFL
ncbi:hypothetical protein GX411_10870 [Candidatus Fermentibacteria bacterium]|nr:hypothetical protein [Candidatus Fermentibacteria bacterium]